MNTGQFWWLAAVIGAHEGGQVIGRTRLQKTVKLLQRLGLPTDYLYTIFFYGPYSEGVFSDVRLLEQLGLVKETERSTPEGAYLYAAQATTTDLPDVERFRPAIRRMEKADAVVLELAATYDAFREMGADHTEAVERLRRKKGAKCDSGRQEAALALLRELGLPAGEDAAAAVE